MAVDEPERFDVVEHDNGHVELTLRAEPASAAAARLWIHRRWADLPEEELDDVLLIVTELISNAIRHGQPEIKLMMRMDPFAIDVAVLDHGPEMPPYSTRRPPDNAKSGRGLLVIDKLALDWGVQPLVGETGKIVWAAVERI